MLRIGEVILATYSLIVLLSFIIMDLKGIKKNKYSDWLTVIYTPTIILLLNIIWRR